MGLVGVMDSLCVWGVWRRSGIHTRRRRRGLRSGGNPSWGIPSTRADLICLAGVSEAIGFCTHVSWTVDPSSAFGFYE